MVLVSQRQNSDFDEARIVQSLILAHELSSGFYNGLNPSISILSSAKRYCEEHSLDIDHLYRLAMPIITHMDTTVPTPSDFSGFENLVYGRIREAHYHNLTNCLVEITEDKNLSKIENEIDSCIRSLRALPPSDDLEGMLRSTLVRAVETNKKSGNTRKYGLSMMLVQRYLE
jgi:hypothetical protein